YIFTTPSHHRVHHATNAKYIDKNYGSTFIIWDRMFGTFQPEEEQAIYGITKPVNSHNPVYLVFHAWMEMFRDLWRYPKASWKILFGSPTEYERNEVKKMKMADVDEEQKRKTA
ncbi:MAG: sterol desaturase family protein, partial [Bacteroidia bacterium]|nr:sterol desaturase family protein [Bacteroidia bacterium]